MSKRILESAILMETMLGLGSSDYFDYFPKLRKGKTQKTYTNKNANIEYYTDEKGNIRKRKIRGK